MINMTLQDTALTIALDGHIDSANAPELEQTIFGSAEPGQVKSLIVDVEALEYISSAGLRVILKLRKRFAKMKIVNASPPCM